jgi:uncharacterized protein YbjT (DUF2867 family)
MREVIMASAGRVLVTGATGNTGTGLVAALLRAGVGVTVFVRNATKAEPMKAGGAEVVVGDLDNPEAIVPAIDGIDKIYLLTWNGPTQIQHAENVIKAARSIGNIHLVRHSMWGPGGSRIIKQGDQIEQAIKSSGLPWTLLKPTFFMQNTMMAAQTISSQGVIYWDMKDGRLGMIDVRDIVDAALAVLTGAGHEGKSYILTGPAAISFHDVARTFTDILGKKVMYVSVPGEAALKSMTDMGMPEWIARGYIELSEGFSNNFADSVTSDVATLTGHPARSFEQFVRDHAQVFGGKRMEKPRRLEHIA